MQILQSLNDNVCFSFGHFKNCHSNTTENGVNHIMTTNPTPAQYTENGLIGEIKVYCYYNFDSWFKKQKKFTGQSDKWSRDDCCHQKMNKSRNKTVSK